MKRLFYDIETSLGIYSAFGQSFKTRIGPQHQIIEPRIICICYKWQNESKVYSIEWNEGNDKKLIRSFIKVLNQSDESIGHNSSGFDLPWIRGRAFIHRIPMRWDYPKDDTLKLVRKNAGNGFKLQSNRLDSIAQDLGIGKKNPTTLELWDRITFPCYIPGLFPMTKDYRKALDYMVKYCKQDVNLLEKLWEMLTPYVKPKNHMGVVDGGEKWDCPRCASGNVVAKGMLVLASGIKKKRTRCRDCGSQFQISMKTWRDWEQFKVDLKKFNIQL